MKIAHIHVFDQLNKGDVAIVESIQKLLKDRLDDVEILNFDMLILKNYDKRIINEINLCDLVVIGGGGVFVRYFLPFSDKSIESINQPIIILGAGYNLEFGASKFDDSLTNNISLLTNKACLTSVRDQFTSDFLKTVGMEKKIWVTGDPASFLNFRDSSFNSPMGKSIGFNITYSGWLEFGKYKKEIIDSYSSIMEYFSTEKQYKVYYLLHHASELEIIKELKFRDFEIIDLPPKEQMFFYSKLDLVIGMMLHCTILSFGANTPMINVAYDNKNLAFANLIGIPEIITLPQEITVQSLQAKAEKFINQKDSYKNRLEESKKELLKLTLDFIDQIPRSCSI